MLRQVECSRIVDQIVEVALWFSVLQLAYLSLSKPQPSSEDFLIERLAIQSQKMRMVSEHLNNLADVLALEGGQELRCLEEFIP